MTTTVRVVGSVDDLGQKAWDALMHARAAIPFLHWGFLSALEQSGSTGARAGWVPRHLVAAEDGRVVGIAPAFVKAHSMGEFVYDWSWADASERMGVAYYPKLVLAAPFSPVGGERLVVAADLAPEAAERVKRTLVAGAVRLAQDTGCAGVHALFCTPDEVRLFERHGFAHRLGSQLHWDNAAYTDFDQFLARFDSKRRNQIRRERRRVKEQGVTVRCLVGDAVPDALTAPAFEFYAATIRRFAWGRRYLNRQFFELLWARMRPYLQVVVAEREGTIVGGSLNLESLPSVGGMSARGAVRFGRYWGALDDVDSLHFEVCAYAAIEDCIARGVVAFEAGAGGDDHKLGRGFLPRRTHSAHLLFDGRVHGVIADFCRREAAHVEAAIAGTEVFAR